MTRERRIDGGEGEEEEEEMKKTWLHGDGSD